MLKATVAGMASPERVILVAGAGLQADLVSVTDMVLRGQAQVRPHVSNPLKACSLMMAVLGRVP